MKYKYYSIIIVIEHSYPIPKPIRIPPPLRPLRPLQLALPPQRPPRPPRPFWHRVSAWDQPPKWEKMMEKGPKWSKKEEKNHKTLGPIISYNVLFGFPIL